MTGSHWRCPAVSLLHSQGAMPEKKRAAARARPFASCFSAQADPAPSLLTFFFGVLLATQQRKSSSSHLGVRAQPKILPPLPPSPPPSPRFSTKKHFRKTDCFDKERARAKKQGFRSKRSTKKKPKKHVLNDRPVDLWRRSIRDTPDLRTFSTCRPAHDARKFQHVPTCARRS